MNKAFAERAIAKLQKLSIEAGGFALALHEYVSRTTTIAWDDSRALFWVLMPDGNWRVAVWLMPIASQFEPYRAGN